MNGSNQNRKPQLNRPKPKRPSRYTDTHVGEMFGEFIRGRFLFCHALGGWHVWDGHRWRRDATESAHEEARQFASALLRQVARLRDDDKREKGLKGVIPYLSKAKIDAVVTIARRLDGIAAEADEFDRHPHLLNCTNGIVDLRTGELSPADPELRLTVSTGTEFLPGARHSDVDTLLEVVDPKVREWLQVLLGYAATGGVSEDLLPVFDGQGSNGKTTLLGAAGSALGEYASAAPQKLLMKSGRDEHPALLADLRGKRLVTVEETAEGGALNVEQIKMLTGGSAISARFMGRNYFSFEPTHKIILATNHRPRVASSDYAIWRRLRLVPFPHRYSRPEKGAPGDRPLDPELRDRLKRSDQRAAMLAWIIEGAKRWYVEGLCDPTDVENATEHWRAAEDVILRFTRDRLVFEPDSETSLASMFDEWKDWCEEEVRPPGSQREFGAQFSAHPEIEAHSVSKIKRKKGWIWRGVQAAGGDRGDRAKGSSLDPDLWTTA